MIQHLEWAPKAEKDYDNNIDYLILEYPIEVTTKFIQRVDHVIDLIKQGNVTFLSTEYRDVYKIVIVPKITLYYRIIETSNTLQLLRFRNNRKDTKKFEL